MEALPTPREPPVASARHGLILLRGELNRSIIAALGRRAMTQVELGDWLVVSSRTTLLNHLDALLEAGVIERQEPDGAQNRVEYSLTLAGGGLLGLVAVATRWLTDHPGRRLESVSPVGWRAFAALADAWEAAILESLAHRPCSDTELSGMIAGLSERKIERELHRLRGAGLIAPVQSKDGDNRYALTPWGRRSIGVLAAAARWELTYMPRQSEPIIVRDALVALLVALPLVRLPEGISGLCALTAEAEAGDDVTPRSGVVWAQLREGRVVSCGEGKSPRVPDAWVWGPFGGWLAAVIDGRGAALRIGGDRRLARGLLGELHVQLYDYD